MGRRRPGPRRLDGAEQSLRLMRDFPSFRRIRRGNPYIWEGTLKPETISATYKIRITCHHGRRPLVDVIDPPLVPREEGGPVPHTFRPGRICLHLTEEWDGTKFISQTIVPWASLWLLHYEFWKADGKWLGGGHEPADSDEEGRT
jgi:hypothetical protein